ncbi:hypothetical protein QWJ34_16560 [Saccharibacillus sp. CPCC 101409]|uniref:HEAT repeat domain-containing protein n=1 Tax=Saccharibacillus sp. CPCC 101409 TaxID=3058041 RepID=UPI002670D639|nr:hypothetical protein [Saccharibacillus sp. CPCC 101409]MDO3411380.1 hypothetical protein [Saccharibacillus sp. CPCC 101409]
MNDSAILEVVWTAIAVLLLLIFLVLFYLVNRKVRRGNRRKRIREAADRLNAGDSPLSVYLGSGERSRRLDVSGGPLRREALETTLLERLAVSASETERERIFRFAAVQFAEEYDRLLHARRWSDRMNALLHVEQFRMAALEDSIVRRLGELGAETESDDERFLLIRTLSSLQLDVSLDYLDTAAERFSELQLMQILRPMRGGLLDRLIRETDTLPRRIARCLIDTLRLENIRTNEVLELLERSMRSDDPEMRIRALKALANFGYLTPEASERLESRMAEGEAVAWPERLMHARLAGVVREERFEPHLERMIADSSYEVRREAAASLSKYRDGHERMRRIADEHPDRFARDIAAETLERRAYERHVG